MPEERRHATLLAFAIHLEVTAQDEARDVLTQLVKELFRRATQRATTQRLRTLGDLDTAALRLREACALLLDPAYPDHAVRGAGHRLRPRLAGGPAGRDGNGGCADTPTR